MSYFYYYVKCRYGKYRNADCHYGLCNVFFIVMLSVVILTVTVLNVIAPLKRLQINFDKKMLFASIIIK